MKQLLLALLLVSLASSALADSPEAILKDYRKAATQAVERLNQSLEKAATPIITKLVKDGDTDGAEELTGQLKAKLAGEAVSAPQASAVQLFSLYDEARAKALAPVQKSSIARIDSQLKTAGGAKLETVTELGKVREEIETGKAAPPLAGFVKEWTYHLTAGTDHVSGTVTFARNGTLKLDFPNNKDEGTWKKTKESNTYETHVNGEKGLLIITGQVAEWKRGAVVRYLKAKAGSPPL